MSVGVTPSSWLITTTTSLGLFTRNVLKSSSAEARVIDPSSQKPWQRKIPGFPRGLGPSRDRICFATCVACGPISCSRSLIFGTVVRSVRTIPFGSAKP